MELVSKLVRVEHSFVCGWGFDTSESRSEIPGKFWNVLEKDGGHQLDQSCEKEEVLDIVKGERSILHTVKKKEG